MIYSDDAKNFRCHIPLFCINVKCLSCPFPGKRQRQWLFAFHPGIPGPAGLKGAKGDYGIKGLKGEPGLKGARGDTGFSGKALCHRICGDVGTFGFGTVDHRPTKASLGVFSELICRNSTERSAFPAEESAGCQLYTLGGVLKDMQVHRCIRFSQISDFTEKWNSPHSSLLCSGTSETPCYPM